MKALVVDDNPMITELLTINMEYMGHEVDAAEDGEDAVDRLCKKDYDVVITDGYMPRMTGFDLCRFIRSKYPSIYIIGVTGSTNLKEFADAGANVYFAKPFRFSSLKRAIEGHFSTLERTDH